MKYHKINGVFKRYTKEDDKKGLIPEGKKWGEFIDGEWATPEFEALKDIEWTFTEKIDGMNIRIYITPSPGFCQMKGKTDEAQIPKPLDEWFDKWDEEYSDKAVEMFKNADEVILYGEGVGEKIQKGNHGFTDYEVILFDVKIGNYWLRREQVEEIAKELGMRSVVVVERSTLSQAIEDMKSRVEKGAERNSAFGDWKMEGLVGVPTANLLDRSCNRIITKIKYKDFR